MSICPPDWENKPSGPVITRKEIVTGDYGPGACLRVRDPQKQLEQKLALKLLCIEVLGAAYSQSEIREFARLLTEIADAMEEAKP